MSTANMFVTVLTVSCFSLALSANVVVKKIEVQMGAVGSDDDIRIKMCEGSKCCTTDKLSNILGSEWDAKKKEKWDGGKLGNCSDVSFSDNLPFLDATIIKKGKKDKEGPEVVNMNITGRIGKDKKNVVIFNCGIYKLSKTDRQKSGKCINPKYVAPVSKSLPPPSLSSVPIVANYNINKISVQMGDDGTDDDVSLEICNKQSTKNCCDTGKLDKTLKDDWKKKKLEVWEKKHLGSCKSQIFDACKGFDVSIKKKASKDTLKVSTITLEVSDAQKSSVKQSFICSDYNHGTKDTATRRSCVIDSKSSLKCGPKSKTSGSNPGVKSSSLLVTMSIVFLIKILLD